MVFGVTHCPQNPHPVVEATAVGLQLLFPGGQNCPLGLDPSDLAPAVCSGKGDGGLHVSRAPVAPPFPPV